jgi:hypothetical protein
MLLSFVDDSGYPATHEAIPSLTSDRGEATPRRRCRCPSAGTGGTVTASRQHCGRSVRRGAAPGQRRARRLGGEHGEDERAEGAARRRSVNHPGFRACLPSWEVMPRCQAGTTVRRRRRRFVWSTTTWPTTRRSALRSLRSPRGWERLRKWIRQSDVDAGKAPGVPTEASREIRELKGKCRELEQVHEPQRPSHRFRGGCAPPGPTRRFRRAALAFHSACGCD